MVLSDDTVLFRVDDFGLRRVLKGYQSQIGTLEKQLQNKDEEIQSLNTKLTDLTNTVGRMQEEHEAQFGGFDPKAVQAEMVRITEKQKAGDEAILDAKAYVDNGVKNVTTLSLKIEQRIVNCEARVVATESTIPTLCPLNVAEKRFDQIDDVKNLLEREFPKIHKTTENHELRITKLEGPTVDSLRAELDAASARLRMAIDEVSVASTSSFDRMADKIERHDRRIESISKSLGGDLDSLKSELNSVNADISDSRNMAKTLMAAQKRFVAEFTGLRTSNFEELENLGHSSRSMVAELQQGIADARIELENLREDRKQDILHANSATHTDGKCLSCLQPLPDSHGTLKYKPPTPHQTQTHTPSRQATVSAVDGNGFMGRPASAPVRTIKQRKEQLQLLRQSIVEQRLGTAALSRRSNSNAGNLSSAEARSDGESANGDVTDNARPRSASGRPSPSPALSLLSSSPQRQPNQRPKSSMR